MRVLLAPHGTRGDVQPMIALAIGLRAHGHDVAFVAPANFVGWIRASGFECESDGIDVEAVMRSSTAHLQSLSWQVRYLKELLIPRQFETLARIPADHDLIVASGVQLAAASMAERWHVPYAAAAFAPCVVPSSTAPPPFIRWQTLPAWLNRLLWLLGKPIADAVLRGPINDGRARLGLRPVSSPMDLLIGRVIVATDPDLAPLGHDAPPRVVTTDAWILDDSANLDRRLEAFLDAGSPPVYVGFGSMVSNRATEFVSRVAAAAHEVGCRLLVAGGWAALGAALADSDQVMSIEAAPHRMLFPRVAAVMHHGGAGTTTAAAAAGVPQLVLPHILDQFYWAHRVEILGLGPPSLPITRVTVRALTARLAKLVREPRFRERAIDLGSRVAARNGVPAAVEYLTGRSDVAQRRSDVAQTL